MFLGPGPGWAARKPTRRALPGATCHLHSPRPQPRAASPGAGAARGGHPTARAGAVGRRRGGGGAPGPPHPRCHRWRPGCCLGACAPQGRGDAHTHSHSLSLSRSHTHTHIYTRTLSPTHIISHTHTLTLAGMSSKTFSHTHTHTHRHTTAQDRSHPPAHVPGAAEREHTLCPPHRRTDPHPHAHRPAPTRTQTSAPPRSATSGCDPPLSRRCSAPASPGAAPLTPPARRAPENGGQPRAGERCRGGAQLARPQSGRAPMSLGRAARAAGRCLSHPLRSSLPPTPGLSAAVGPACAARPPWALAGPQRSATAPSAARVCWSCGSGLDGSETFACGRCRCLQPEAAEATYFRILGMYDP